MASSEIDSSDWLVSQAEMAEYDKRTISAGVSSEELMERAGQLAFEAIYQRLLKFNYKQPLILVGSGNNGGDGLVIARLLKEKGVAVKVIIVSAKKYSSEMLKQLDKFVALTGEPYLFNSVNTASSPLKDKDGLKVLEEAEAFFSSSDLLIDALLGTGQRSSPYGDIAELLSLANTCQVKERIAIDIPTGINGDTGTVYENAFKATTTYTIQFAKKGLWQYPAHLYCGAIEVLPIGIQVQPEEIGCHILTRNKLKLLPRRSVMAHKSNYGHVAVLAGSRNMSGAGVLVSNASIKSGAGLVTKFQVLSAYALGTPEIMYHYLDDAGCGYFTASMADEILAKLKNATVLVVGPGLGLEASTAECVEKVLKNTTLPTVIDASALSFIAKNPTLKLPPETVLTPHTGEAARLLQCQVEDVIADRFWAAESISKRYQAVVVLKGAGTIICDARKTDSKLLPVQSYVSEVADGYLAVSGSGDVLAGIISACLAQGLSALDAAKLAVYAHAQGAIRAKQTKDFFIVASDIINYLKLEDLTCI